MTLIVNEPKRKIEPDNVFEPTPTSTGIGSPVNEDISRLPCPSITSPSAGTISPTRTMMTSPTFKSSGFTVTILFSHTKLAVSARKSIALEIAFFDLPVANAPINSPIW